MTLQAVCGIKKAIKNSGPNFVKTIRVYNRVCINI